MHGDAAAIEAPKCEKILTSLNYLSGGRDTLLEVEKYKKRQSHEEE